jgi:hypothetical protein
VSERRLVAAAAVLLGLVPLAAPLLPLGYRGPDLRAGTALALALILSYLLAAVLGGSVIARDLGERRLGFYFSRPLSGWAIWGGKLLAALLLALGSGLLVLLPSVLLGDRLDPGGSWGQGLAWGSSLVLNAVLWAGSVAALLLLANAAAVMVRSRSPWLLLDLAAALVLGALVWVLVVELLLAGAFGALVRGQLALLAALVVALGTASAVQVLRARTDLRLGHRLLSLTLWSSLGLAVLGIGIYGRWVLAASPEDLESIPRVLPAPAGDWLALSGRAAGRAGFEPTFLLNVSSGRYFRIRGAFGLWGGLAFSRDGRRVVWLEPGGRRVFPLTLSRLDLDRPGARPVQAPISFSDWMPGALALSGDGRRLAVIHKDRILVSDLGTGRLLVSHPMPGEPLWNLDRLRFLGSGALRFYGSRQTGNQTELRILDLDPGSGRVLRSLRLPFPDGWVQGLSADGQRILVETRRTSPTSPEFQVLDLSTGELSALVRLPGILGNARFLPDGRLLVATRGGGRVSLRLLDGKGTELRRFELPGDHVDLGGQPVPGWLAVAVTPEHSSRKRGRWRVLLLDLEHGARRPLGERMVPVGSPDLPPGSLGTELFLRGDGGLVRIDPKTGRTSVILHEGAH